MILSNMHFNTNVNFLETKKYANKTNQTKFNVNIKNGSKCLDFFTEKPIINDCNDNTPVKNNKEEEHNELDETDVFIQKLLKEEEGLIKLQIKVKLEEEKKNILIKEIDKKKKSIEAKKMEAKKLKTNLDRIVGQIKLIDRENHFLDEMLNFTLNQNLSI